MGLSLTRGGVVPLASLSLSHVVVCCRGPLPDSYRWAVYGIEDPVVLSAEGEQLWDVVGGVGGSWYVVGGNWRIATPSTRSGSTPTHPSGPPSAPDIHLLPPLNSSQCFRLSAPALLLLSCAQAWSAAFEPYTTIPASAGSVPHLPVAASPSDIGLGLNPASGRSMHQLHIHMVGERAVVWSVLS